MGTVDREEVDRLRKRFMKLDKVWLDLATAQVMAKDYGK